MPGQETRSCPTGKRPAGMPPAADIPVLQNGPAQGQKERRGQDPLGVARDRPSLALRMTLGQEEAERRASGCANGDMPALQEGRPCGASPGGPGSHGGRNVPGLEGTPAAGEEEGGEEEAEGDGGREGEKAGDDGGPGGGLGGLGGTDVDEGGVVGFI